MKQEYLDKILEIMRLRGCSERSIANYISAIKRFLNYYKDEDMSKFEEENIRDYLNTEFINKGLASSTYNVNRAAILYFYKIVFKKRFDNYLLPQCKTTKEIPKLVDIDIVVKLINGEKNLEHKLWLCLAFGSGLRVSEISSLKIENILSKEHKLKVLGKRKKERFVPLPQYTLVLLREYYRAKRFTIKSGYLFNCHDINYNHLKSASISNYFRELRKKYQIPIHITMHTLRHTYATEYMKNGGDLWDLKALLGHSSINTTSIYIHTSKNFDKIYNPLDTYLK